MGKRPTTTTVVVDPIRTESLSVTVLGGTPTICHRLADKARHELLLPSGRKTQADRAQSLKHDPIREFQDSPYTLADEDAPTLLALRADMFKGAMMSAATDLPGATRAKIGRLVIVDGTLLPLYGLPQIFSAITRSADMDRTPDVRTRAIVPHWAAQLTITFATPLLNARSIINLLAAAGKICGVGDWRPEKGKGSFGQFLIVDPDDERVLQIMTEGDRAAQAAAMAAPVAYDRETEELLAWFETELTVRGKGREVPSGNHTHDLTVADVGARSL